MVRRAPRIVPALVAVVLALCDGHALLVNLLAHAAELGGLLGRQFLAGPFGFRRAVEQVGE